MKMVASVETRALEALWRKRLRRGLEHDLYNRCHDRRPKTLPVRSSSCGLPDDHRSAVERRNSDDIRLMFQNSNFSFCRKTFKDPAKIVIVIVDLGIAP